MEDRWREISADYTQVICYPSGQITSSGAWLGANPLYYTLPLLLAQLSSCIIISRVVQVLLRPLRQPTIVSDLLGGIVLGPTILGQFPTVYNALFPDRGIFLERMLSCFAVVYHLLSIGVKMNFRLLSKGRNVFIIGITTLLLPYVITGVLVIVLRSHSMNDFSGVAFPLKMVTGTSAASFPVMFHFLHELHFLNTELGRLSLSIAALHDAFAFISFTLLAFDKLEDFNFENLFYRLGVLAFVIVVTFLVIRPMLFWVIERTPEGKHVEQGYVIAILLGALVMSIWSEVFGSGLIQASIIFGLAIPDGPPLGSTITDKIDAIDKLILQPMFYVGIGQRVNVFARSSWHADVADIGIMVANRVMKIVGALVSAAACRMPLRDGLSLGLLVNVRGFIHFLQFQVWEDTRFVTPQTYGMLVMGSLTTVMVVTPIITHLMKQSRTYTPYARRTIQHSKHDAELGLLTYVHEEEDIAPILNLIEVTNGTQERPICIHVMHLVELVGRATPMLVAHKPHGKATELQSSSANVFSAFRSYSRHRDGSVMLQLFTSISPFETMHEDICFVALQKRVSLIIVPFHKRQVGSSGSQFSSNALQIINPNVVAQAPCSVGILVDRGGLRSRASWTGLGASLYRVGVLFLGGPDDREALSYAARMVEHPCVVLRVVRFISYDQSGQNAKEKQLDDYLLSDFQMSWVGNEKVVYQEAQVEDGEEILNVIHSMENAFDLMVVGRRQKSTVEIFEGLSAWTESPELGVIGDLCSSSDFFRGLSSVLVIQQQTMAAPKEKTKIYDNDWIVHAPGT